MAYDNSANIRLARLYRKTSKSGNDYFVGRIGGAKVALLKSREVAEDGGEIWDILLSPADFAGNNYRQSFPAKSDAVNSTADDQSPAEITGVNNTGVYSAEDSFGLLNERAARAQRGELTDDEIPF